MSGDLITLTQQPVATSSNTTQPMIESLDVSAYDYLDFIFYLTATNSVGSIGIITGMDLHDDTTWKAISGVSAGLATVTPPGTVLASTWSLPLMRYVRWQTSGLTGTASFMIKMMARRFK